MLISFKGFIILIMGSNPNNVSLTFLKNNQNHGAMNVNVKKVKSITMYTVCVRSNFFNISLLFPFGIF